MPEAIQLRAFTGIANDGTGGSVVAGSAKRHRFPNGTLAKLADAFEARYGLQWTNPNTGEVVTLSRTENVTARVLDFMISTLDGYEHNAQQQTAVTTANAAIQARKAASVIE